MENKESNQKKNYINFVDIFKFKSIERKFKLGQLLSSFEYLPEEVFLIKEGNARLISKINGQLTSISKLSKGDFIGIASILNGFSLEEVRASKDLIVYSLKNHEFIRLYQEQVDIKNYCDNNIWHSEINEDKVGIGHLKSNENIIKEFAKNSVEFNKSINVSKNLT